MTKNSCCVFRPAFGCCAHPKAGQTTFFSRFQLFLFILITKKGLKWRNKVENGWKKVFQPAFGCAQHAKSVRNTQQTLLNGVGAHSISGRSWFTATGNKFGTCSRFTKPVDQTDLKCLLSIDDSASHDQVQGSREANQTGQTNWSSIKEWYSKPSVQNSKLETLKWLIK